jgi:hypothetical protein
MYLGLVATGGHTQSLVTLTVHRYLPGLVFYQLIKRKLRRCKVDIIPDPRQNNGTV